MPTIISSENFHVLITGAIHIVKSVSKYIYKKKVQTKL